MFHFENNYGLFVGALTTNEFHKHYALQLSVSTHSNMRMTRKGASQTYADSFYITSNTLHQLISPEPQLTILINPLSPLGHQFYLNYKTLKVTSLESSLKKELVHILHRLQTKKITFDTFCLHIKNRMYQYQCDCEDQYHPKDDRIRNTLLLFEENFEKIYSLEEIAELSNLSTSRFLHLFKDVTGLNFRRYQLWNKMIKSLPYLITHSITDTAHTFGFTDSSHYTRTFKETFGVTPKFMFQKE
ncbi:helix-turn-helix transcriptional regulator [Aquimarina sp. TRL1]|uniref:helix-turn-helix transcriptional regulator n=1 Tax=Aquimarina sp. (strain TRL1) TaxID=2736252 RepID=UPI0015890F88|nr:AraC family transcriptional regulator [Aquimarina sp. TRL1]QKX06681.1 helix-turn-helix transcriptional regulator [Aquimarina sp. TRL1]